MRLQGLGQHPLNEDLDTVFYVKCGFLQGSQPDKNVNNQFFSGTDLIWL